LTAAADRGAFAGDAVSEGLTLIAPP
jgi:hypothetical protein